MEEPLPDNRFAYFLIKALDVLTRVFGTLALPESEIDECDECREQLQPRINIQKDMAASEKVQHGTNMGFVRDLSIQSALTRTLPSILSKNCCKWSTDVLVSVWSQERTTMLFPKARRSVCCRKACRTFDRITN